MKRPKAHCSVCGFEVPVRVSGVLYFHRTGSNPTGCPGGGKWGVYR